MIKHITDFFKFLLPILRSAVVQVAADELTRIAYPPRPGDIRRGYTRRPQYTSYNRMAPPRERLIRSMAPVQDGFHDVLMVAFDLKGTSAGLVHEWLHNQMPKPGMHSDDIGKDIDLDSWWVANDERFDGSDTDSAVFVAKGNQKKAREVLWEAGLSHEYGHRS